MLVAISDLHLDDGTIGKSLSADAFHIFRERLEQLAYSASLRADGSYRPLESIDLLLLGDIFEMIHSTRWLKEKPGEAGYVRPWDDPAQAALAAKTCEITQAILEHNFEAMSIFRRMAKGEAITLPPANAQGRPAFGTNERLPVPVNMYYMVGNHDWFFHLPGEAFTPMRRLIVDGMCLQNPPAPIAYEPQEWEPLVGLFEKYRIFARHGDCYDRWSYNTELGRNAATLGDALCVELINRFPEEVERHFGDALPTHFYRGLHEMINVRPNVAVPLWIEGQLRQYEVMEKVEATLKDIWNRLVEEFLQLDFIRAFEKRWNPFDSVDELSLVLKLSRWTSIENFNRVILLIKKRLFRDDQSMAKHAIKEHAFTSRQADFIVYGHTHHHEIIPLDTYHRQGKENYQFLVNTGTWRSCYDLTRYRPEQQKFLPYQLMSYLAFFIDGERHGRRHEAWSGKLV
jgi:UDP-2,3-diacylglucosamine pyrophosphatase LpxH